MPDVYLPPAIRNTPLAQVYIDAWIDSGDPQMAWEEVRSHADYETYFPGNRREDGSVIYDENTYQSVIESYEDVLLSINVNPDLFTDKFAGLVQGFVSPQEFAQRIDSQYEGIIDQVPEVRQWYVDNGFAFEPTREAIIASILDPDIGDQILAGNISMAQVGGQASRRDFNISVDFARQLTQAGLDTSAEASQFFALAEGTVPALQTLARRHADPDDDFDLEEFTQAQLFEDPDQRRRMRRLLAQERASFSDSVAGVGAFARSESGGFAGLEQR